MTNEIKATLAGYTGRSIRFRVRLFPAPPRNKAERRDRESEAVREIHRALNRLAYT